MALLGAQILDKYTEIRIRVSGHFFFWILK